MVFGIGAMLLAVTWFAPAQGRDPNVCALVTAAQISSALGSAPTSSDAGSREIDDELKAKGWTCSRQVGKQILSFDVVEFQSAADAATAMAKALKMASEDPDALKLTATPGVGEQAAWGTEEGGALWVTRQGKYMLSVVLAGEVPDPQRYKESLRRLAQQALAKLGS